MNIQTAQCHGHHRSYDQVRAEVLQARASRDIDYEASHERIVGAEPAVLDDLIAFLDGCDYEDIRWHLHDVGIESGVFTVEQFRELFGWALEQDNVLVTPTLLNQESK